MRLLARILNEQPDTNVTFQEPPLLPWTVDPAAALMRGRLRRILQSRKEHRVGDVASFHLPYLEEAVRLEPGIRCICLKRPCEEVVAGFNRFLDGTSRFPTNYWTNDCGNGWYPDPLWARVFPKYDTNDRTEGIRRYWEEYYERMDGLVRQYPDNIRLWDTEILTREEGAREVLSFAGVPESEQVIMTGERMQPGEPEVLQPVSPPHEEETPPAPRQECVILVPYSGSITQECADSLQELERRGYPVWRAGGFAAIDQGRNQLATDALLKGFKETLWIDSDIGFHPDAVETLRSHPHPIICGVYPQKGKRALACHILPQTESMRLGSEGGVHEILYAATGFLLVRRKVYLTLQHEMNLPVCNERFEHPMIPFFQPLVRPIEDGYWYLAEDFAFSHRARQCGYRVYADTTIRLWHVGSYRYGWEDAARTNKRYDSFEMTFDPEESRDFEAD